MGHGVSLSNYNGLTITELLSGEKTKRTDFFAVNRRIVPIPPEPFKYVTISAIRAFLRFEDKKGVKQANKEKDRKSTRLNSSHVAISYAVFCLKKKKTKRDAL